MVMTMRSDYLGDCSQFPDLPERINDGIYLVPRLRRDQLMEAITAPAEAVGKRIAPGLVQRLVNDTGNDPDALPRLQHLLTRMWALASVDEVGLEDYEKAGGWAGGLSAGLNEVFDRLDKPRATDHRADVPRALRAGRDQSNYPARGIRCRTLSI